MSLADLQHRPLLRQYLRSLPYSPLQLSQAESLRRGGHRHTVQQTVLRCFVHPPRSIPGPTCRFWTHQDLSARMRILLLHHGVVVDSATSLNKNRHIKLSPPGATPRIWRKIYFLVASLLPNLSPSCTLCKVERLQCPSKDVSAMEHLTKCYLYPLRADAMMLSM